VCQPYRHGCDILLDEENELDIRLVEALETIAGRMEDVASSAGALGAIVDGLKALLCAKCKGTGMLQPIKDFWQECAYCNGLGH
jgi:DnaJ-class molecular chaperone